MKLLLLLVVQISILISNKGSEKGSDSVDFYCNVVKFEISLHCFKSRSLPSSDV